MKICLDCSKPSPSVKRWGGGTLLCERCRKLRDSKRNRDRSKIYNAEWAEYSRAKRAAQPWCSLCFATTDLTTDHATNTVQCRSCNSKHRGTTIPD